MFEVARVNRLLIVVRSIGDGRRAFSLAEQQHMPLTVISCGETVRATGVGYFNRAVEAAAADYPSVGYDVIHDCSNSFSLALDALRSGAKLIKMTDDYRSYFKVLNIAEKFGAKVVKGDKRNLK